MELPNLLSKSRRSNLRDSAISMSNGNEQKDIQCVASLIGKERDLNLCEYGLMSSVNGTSSLCAIVNTNRGAKHWDNNELASFIEGGSSM